MHNHLAPSDAALIQQERQVILASSIFFLQIITQQSMSNAYSCHLQGAGALYDRSSNLSILLVEHDAQVCEVEHGQESEDEVDEDGHEVALLVLEVDSRLAPRTHGRVEDGRQLLAQP